MTLLGAIVAAVVAGAGTGWAAGPILRWCPEPVDVHDKPATYRALATPRFRTGVALLAAGATLTACTFTPAPLLPLWLVASTLGVLIAVVDAALTWVPARLSHLSWAATALSLIGVQLLTGSWPQVGTIVAAAVAVGLTFVLVWRITYPNLGFADVRFAPVVAALAASLGLTSLFASVLATTVVAAMHLLIRRARQVRGLQPYTPAMLAGPFLSVVAAVVVGQPL